MKKILFIAVALISSSVIMPAMAQSKKEKKQKNKTEVTCKHANSKHHEGEKHCNRQAGECCKKVVQLTTASDSLSYAAGMNMTDGLMPFLKQQFDVDTANINDVARGFRHAIKKIENKEFKAFVAGEQIAAMMAERMLPAKETEYKYAENQINPDVLYQGFIDALTNIDSAKIGSDDAKAYEKTRREEAKKATERAMKAEGEAFLAENAKQEGVVTLPSGLQYKVLREGNGAIPKATDEVVVKYEGTLIDGTKFDSSYDRNPQTATFRPTQVIKGWTEALTMMPVGSKWMLFIPENLAYGERQAGKIPPYSTLIFTVELDAIK